MAGYGWNPLSSQGIKAGVHGCFHVWNAILLPAPWVGLEGCSPVYILWVMRYSVPAQFTMPGRLPVLQDILSICRSTEHTRKGVTILCRMPAVAEATEPGFPNHRLFLLHELFNSKINLTSLLVKLLSKSVWAYGQF